MAGSDHTHAYASKVPSSRHYPNISPTPELRAPKIPQKEIFLNTCADCRGRFRKIADLTQKNRYVCKEQFELRDNANGQGKREEEIQDRKEQDNEMSNGEGEKAKEKGRACHRETREAEDSYEGGVNKEQQTANKIAWA